jgi:hypothetical protein
MSPHWCYLMEESPNKKGTLSVPFLTFYKSNKSLTPENCHQGDQQNHNQHGQVFFKPVP